MAKRGRKPGSSEGEALPSPHPIRFSEETMRLMQFAVGLPDNAYSSVADYVREAVEAKLIQDRIAEKFETVQRALQAMNDAPPDA